VRLNLGCGHDILPGWVNVDASDQLGPGVEVWDLDEREWPFETGSAEEIRGIDIYEHVWDPVGFMIECHRVLRPGGVLRLQTSYWQCVDAYTDPTHKRFSTLDSFDFWVPGTPYYAASNTQMGGMVFEKIKVEVNPATGQLDVILRRPTDA
jgi:SAM-dependent methyltransferase